MIMQVFTVFDKAVGAHLQPFFCRSKGEALRSFTEAVNDPKNNFNRHSADYTLVYLGTYDDNSGLFATQDPVRIISAQELVVEDLDFVAPNGGR